MFSWIWGSTDQKNNENNAELKEELYEEYARIKSKYPDWIPIIVESPNLLLTKKKYLTRKNLILKTLAEIIRNYCQIQTINGMQPIDPQMPLMLFANGTLIPPGDELGKIYEMHKKPHGFLHIVLYNEPGWGMAKDINLNSQLSKEPNETANSNFN